MNDVMTEFGNNNPANAFCKSYNYNMDNSPARKRKRLGKLI